MFWCPGEQVPDGLLQPAQVQHGRAEEAAEEAEDQESHPLIDLENPRFQKDFWLTFFWAWLYFQNVILRTPKSHPLIDLAGSTLET